MDQLEEFYFNRKKNINELGRNADLKSKGLHLLCEAEKHKYSYNFDWLSRPIIQQPQDIIAFQEIVWKVKPDLIIETGIAHGGSLILSASMLVLLDLCEYGQTSIVVPNSEYYRKVVAVDIDIRAHNRKALEEHPLYPRLKLIEGSSIDETVISQIKTEVDGYEKILICLDSNHTHEHVLAELEAYALLTSPGSYCIVFDTVIEDLPEAMSKDRPWGPGNSPKTAVHQYLKAHPEFEIDKSIQDKLLVTVAPGGYLKRVGEMSSLQITHS